MGCGASVGGGTLAERLESIERDLRDEGRRLQEREEHLAAVREQLERTAAAAAPAAEELRAQLRAHRQESSEELQRQRGLHAERYEELRRAQRRAAALALGDQAQALRARREAAHARTAEALQEAALSAAERLRESAAAAKVEAARLRQRCGCLRGECEATAAELREAASPSEPTAPDAELLQCLAAAQEARARAAHRNEALEALLQSQGREARAEIALHGEELEGRGALLRAGDEELRAATDELCDAQGRLHEARAELQSERSRAAQLQEAVAVCAGHSEDVARLRAMLVDSQTMLAHVREAVGAERSEASRLAGLVGQEEDRARLLLHMLGRFKERFGPQPSEGRAASLGDGLSLRGGPGAPHAGPDDGRGPPLRPGLPEPCASAGRPPGAAASSPASGFVFAGGV